MPDATTATSPPRTGLWVTAACLECCGRLEPVTTPASNGRHSSAVMRCHDCHRRYLVTARLEPAAGEARRG